MVKNLISGEELTPEQVLMRTQLIEKFVHYYYHNNCCRLIPDWESALHRLSLKELRRRHVSIFGVEYTLTVSTGNTNHA